MNTLSKIWSVIEKNRWSIIVPLLGVLLWSYASLSCMPTTESPVRQGVMLSATELQQEYDTWTTNNELIVKKFELAAEDIKRQQEQYSKIESAVMSIVSGNVTTWSGLLNLILGSGIIGVSADNIRKNGVIAGLKRNK